MALLLRNLVIPLFYKNMFLILLETNFFTYIVSAGLVEGCHMIAYSTIGSHLHEIRDYRKAKKNNELHESKTFWLKTIFTATIISINIYFIYKTN